MRSNFYLILLSFLSKNFLIRNQLTFCKELSVEEKLTYLPHPTQTDQTLLKQEAVITVHGIPLSSYIEDIITSKISSNAIKGRQAIDLVINKFNTEISELSKSIDDLKAQVKRSIPNRNIIPEEIEIPHPHFNFTGSDS